MTAATRIFPVSEFSRLSSLSGSEPMRSVVLETAASSIVVWAVQPGQELAAHVHADGQDTWTVLSGSADYYLGNQRVAQLKAGDIAVAHPGQVHGAMNTDPSLPFVFVSIVAPGTASFALAQK